MSSIYTRIGLMQALRDKVAGAMSVGHYVNAERWLMLAQRLQNGKGTFGEIRRALAKDNA